MATCLDCIISDSDSEKKRPCFCKLTPNKLSLKRSASLKESPTKARRGSSLMEKRSLSMSSLNRSRSVQKLDFSMDMSVDGSIHNCSQGMLKFTKFSKWRDCRFHLRWYHCIAVVLPPRKSVFQFIGQCCNITGHRDVSYTSVLIKIAQHTACSFPFFVSYKKKVIQSQFFISWRS